MTGAGGMVRPAAARLRGLGFAGVIAVLAGCATAPTALPERELPAPAWQALAQAARSEPAPQPVACPKELPAEARCLGGTDRAGAHYLIALPAAWNGVLVLHAHGGPTLGPPQRSRAVEDLVRWNIAVRAGYAWAGSTFRQGGVAVRDAAEDTERLRLVFAQHVAVPRRTLLHGQSWGAGVAAMAAETYTARSTGGAPPYDAVLLTSGVIAGATRAYDFRLDLRVVYQHLCGNHPRPDEPAYPLWMGLPEGSPLTRAQLEARVRECLGAGLPAAQRTPEQARRLAALTGIVRIPEGSVQGHLNWATWHFQEMAQRRGGRSVFGNRGVVYRGSGDAALDAAIDAAVPRYTADPEAVQALAADADPSGRIPVPVLSVHALHDPTAFVEMQHRWRGLMQAAGAGERLVQVYTEHAEHSYLADPVYVAGFQTLLDWLEQGRAPAPSAVAAACRAAEARWGPGCRMVEGFEPLPLERRIAPRLRP